MDEIKPVYVYSEAFLRCAPWTPIAFRVQQNTIVKNKPGEEETLINAITCLEAFGVRSDIDDVCAHLRQFKDSELAKRVFRNLRYWRETEPADLITAFELSVDVKGDRTPSFHAKKVFKGFLRAFLRFCLELTNGNKSLLKKLKSVFIDVFQGLSPSNFTLKLKPSGTNFKPKSVNRWIHIVHTTGRKRNPNYDTMIRHLAFLAPRGWGMYSEGGRYRGCYRQWRLPPAFRGFEVDTDPKTTRDWSAMKAAKICLVKKPTMDTLVYVTETKRSRESLKGMKRKIPKEDTSDDEEEVAAPVKVVRKKKRDSQRPNIFSIDLTGDVTPPLTPQTPGVFDFDDLYPQGEIPTPQNETLILNDQEVKHSVHDEGVDGGITVFFDPQPSTFAQDEQSDIDSQQILDVVIKNVFSMQRLTEKAKATDGSGTSCAGIPVPVILPPPDQVSETAASQEDVDMEPAEALPEPSASSSSASSAAGGAQDDERMERMEHHIVTRVPFDPQPSTSGQDEQTDAASQQGLVIKDVFSMQELPETERTTDVLSTNCAGIPVPVIFQPPDQVSQTAVPTSEDDVDMEPAEALTTPSSSSSSASSAADGAEEEQSVPQGSDDITAGRETAAGVARANLAAVSADTGNADVEEQPRSEQATDLLRRAWGVPEVRRCVTHILLELTKHFAKELEHPGSSDVIAYK